jgi:hypothetical protein
MFSMGSGTLGNEPNRKTLLKLWKKILLHNVLRHLGDASLQGMDVCMLHKGNPQISIKVNLFRRLDEESLGFFITS